MEGLAQLVNWSSSKRNKKMEDAHRPLLNILKRQLQAADIFYIDKDVMKNVPPCFRYHEDVATQTNSKHHFLIRENLDVIAMRGNRPMHLDFFFACNVCLNEDTIGTILAFDYYPSSSPLTLEINQKQNMDVEYCQSIIKSCLQGIKSSATAGNHQPPQEKRTRPIALSTIEDIVGAIEDLIMEQFVREHQLLLQQNQIVQKMVIPILPHLSTLNQVWKNMQCASSPSTSPLASSDEGDDEDDGACCIHASPSLEDISSFHQKMTILSQITEYSITEARSMISHVTLGV